MEQILIVEDAESLREVLATILEGAGFLVDTASCAETALGLLEKKSYSCILSDYKLPAKTGLDLLKISRDLCPQTPFIVMTAYGTIEMAVDALKQGANDYITKPFDPDHICKTIRDVIEYRRVVDRTFNRSNKWPRRFLTQDPVTEKILLQAKKAAAVDTTVLLLGESGTGKELIARQMHELSLRRDHPFVAVSCGAMPSDLLESELFGHSVGAFTGATQERSGLFEIAAAGTLFLDEIGDMSNSLQVKLLRVLQEHEIKPLGSNKSIKVNPRIIAATNHNIEAALNSGQLREDFYFRLAVISLTIPALRFRAADIDLLTDYYLEYHCNRFNKSGMIISAAAHSALRAHSWPGNARELENVIERAVILAETQIEPKHLGFEPRLDLAAINEAAATLPEITDLAIRQVEMASITKALAKTFGNKSKAAKILGVSYKTLLSKIKDYQISYSVTD